MVNHVSHVTNPENSKFLFILGIKPPKGWKLTKFGNYYRLFSFYFVRRGIVQLKMSNNSISFSKMFDINQLGQPA